MSLLAKLALFHPGHGTTEPTSWTHYLTEPVHVLVLASLAAVAVVGGAVWYRRADIASKK